MKSADIASQHDCIYLKRYKVVYRGTAARALLATVGGTSVKLFYGNLKETIEGNDHKKSYVQPRIG